MGGDLMLKSEASGSIDALTRGTLEGAQLLLNIVAMLVVFVALVALVNLVIAPYTLQGALGWVLAPLAWLAGIPWEEARAAGALLGTKTVINELVAYLELSQMSDLSERSRLLLTYALVRLRQLRQPRHHDRRPRHHVARAARRDSGPGDKVDRRRHAGDLSYGGDGSADPVVPSLQQVHLFRDSRTRGRAIASFSDEA